MPQVGGSYRWGSAEPAAARVHSQSAGMVHCCAAAGAGLCAELSAASTARNANACQLTHAPCSRWTVHMQVGTVLTSTPCKRWCAQVCAERAAVCVQARCSAAQAALHALQPPDLTSRLLLSCALHCIAVLLMVSFVALRRPCCAADDEAYPGLSVSAVQDWLRRSHSRVSDA